MIRNTSKNFGVESNKLSEDSKPVYEPRDSGHQHGPAGRLDLFNKADKHDHHDTKFTAPVSPDLRALHFEQHSRAHASRDCRLPLRGGSCSLLRRTNQSAADKQNGAAVR
jgi:hypothetical protein